MRYVLVTPAKNEGLYIEDTIRSVCSQTRLPERWVIVSDGSTDGTDEIVKGYLPLNPWIEFVRLEKRGERNFAAKVHAFNAGYERLTDLEFDVIGNLDGDISFEEDHFEFLMEKFSEDEDLGVAGTTFREGNKQYDFRFTNIEHVTGTCQLFRRKCFEEIGGYRPNRAGGIDWVAVTSARMMGWKTRTFTEKLHFHNRTMGTATATGLKVRFKQGQKDSFLGGHPLWQVFRALYQIRSKPFFLGGAALYLGYVWAFASGMEKSVSVELMAFNRKEQMSRLRGTLRRVISSGKN